MRTATAESPQQEAVYQEPSLYRRGENRLREVCEKCGRSVYPTKGRPQFRARSLRQEYRPPVDFPFHNGLEPRRGYFLFLEHGCSPSICRADPDLRHDRIMATWSSLSLGRVPSERVFTFCDSSEPCPHPVEVFSLVKTSRFLNATAAMSAKPGSTVSSGRQAAGFIPAGESATNGDRFQSKLARFPPPSSLKLAPSEKMDT